MSSEYVLQCRRKINTRKEVLYEDQCEEKLADENGQHSKAHRRSPLLGNEKITDIPDFEHLGTGLFCSIFEHFKPVPICSGVIRELKYVAQGIRRDQTWDRVHVSRGVRIPPPSRTRNASKQTGTGSSRGPHLRWDMGAQMFNSDESVRE